MRQLKEGRRAGDHIPSRAAVIFNLKKLITNECLRAAVGPLDFGSGCLRVRRQSPWIAPSVQYSCLRLAGTHHSGMDG